MKQSFLSLLLMVPVIAGAVDLNAEDGCYHIADYAQLKEFATVVNGGNVTACGVLDADIVANENLLDPSTGFPTGCDRYNCSFNGDSWTPMKEFNGTFDGKGHYISGLYVFNWNENQGIFANSTNGAIIKNLGLIDSYIKGNNHTGGFVGYLDGSLQIENSYCSATIAGIDVGGFVAIVDKGNAELVVRNSYFDGLVAGSPVGAFVGKVMNAKSVQIYNSYTIGRSIENNKTFSSSFIGSNDNTDVDVTNVFSAGAFVGGNWAENHTLTVEHSYHMTESDQFDAACIGSCAFTSSDVESVTEALKSYSNTDKGIDGSIWGYVDGQPVLNINGGSSEPEPEAFVGIEFTFNSGSSTAWLKEGKDLIYLPRDTIVNRVVVERSFTQGTFATLMLPFNVNMDDKVLQVYKFMGVHKESDGTNSKWVAHYSFVEKGAMVANQPYLVNPIVNINTNELDFSANEITLKANTDTIYEQTAGNWTVKGTYKYILWDDAEYVSPHIFGFAASNYGSTVAGQFVRAANGASIRPMRFFLDYKAPMNRPGLFKSASFALPETIDIVIDDENGENSMTIGKLNTVTGEVKTDRWFDMKGRKLGAKPTFNGIFQNNGRQVIVK